MLPRRALLSAPLLAAAAKAAAQPPFAAFLAELGAEARSRGIRQATIQAALANLQPNPKIIELDRHQPEFTLSWAQYQAKILPNTRIQAGRAAYATNAALLARITNQYGADPRIIIGIWGLESGFGAHTGNYQIVNSLATLAYEGRRAAYFRTELINALKILDSGDITPSAMTGSWAGAMGQPQFMPSSYLHYAVDADQDGRRNIWTSHPDIFASIANYLAKSGWRPGEPWCQRIRLPPDFSPAESGHDHGQPLGAWMQAGIRRIDGSKFSRTDVQGAVIIPDGPAGEAFMAYANFAAIRRYNPSDYYALAVGLLGNASA